MTRSIPRFRGLGRVLLKADNWLTCSDDPESYLAEAIVNDDCRLQLDLRGWEQKFAYYYGEWEAPLIRAVERHYHGGAFYDVGASIGLYSVKFGRLAAARGAGIVRAFEPVPGNLARLRVQLALNDLDERQVQVEPYALGDCEGTVELVLVDGGRPGNAKIVKHGDCRVRQTTLDTVWNERGREPIGFIKVDTEGWDARVIAGGRETITACRPNLLVEFNRERMTNLGIPIEAAWSFLTQELGYDASRIDARGREIRMNAPGEYENVLFVDPHSKPANESGM